MFPQIPTPLCHVSWKSPRMSRFRVAVRRPLCPAGHHCHGYWVNAGKHMVNLGKPMVNLWKMGKTYGKPMVNHGKTMENDLQLMGFPRLCYFTGGHGFVSEWNIPSPLVNHHISHWIAILGASSFFRQTHRSEPGWVSRTEIYCQIGSVCLLFFCNFRAKHCCCW